MRLSRRRFSRIAATAPLMALIPRDGVASPAAPPRFSLPARLIVSCNLYSFNTALTSGAMTLGQVIDFCAGIGFEAVDPTGYYFSTYPVPPPDEEIFRIKLQAFRRGLEVSGTGIRTDFASPDPARRAADVALTGRWVDVAAKLGAPMLRVFAGHGAPAAGAGWLEARDRVLAALTESAAAGARRGVAVVLQNHQDVLRTAEEVLDVTREIRSDWLGLNVDIGSLRTGDPYEEIARLAPFAYTWQIKESVYRRGRAEKTDLGKIVAILRDSGYRGYVPLETLGEGDPRVKVRRLLDEFREALA